jgi:drug/metabolite transporter (DMT)-like permease
MYVLGIATIEIALLTAMMDKIHFDILQRHWRYFVAIGFLVATSTAANYTAVAYIDPGTASLLAKLSIIFGVAFGLIWLRERLTLFQAGGAVIAIVGVFIIAFQPGDYFRIGSLLMLLSTLAYALHAALVKRQQEEIRLAEFFLFRVAFTTLFLFLFALAQQELTWPSPPAWPVLLLAGTVDIVISRGLYYLALRRLDLSLHSIVLTVSPVVAIIWSLFLFDVVPTTAQIVGGLAVLVGVLIVTMGRARLALRPK